MLPPRPANSRHHSLRTQLGGWPHCPWGRQAAGCSGLLGQPGTSLSCSGHGAASCSRATLRVRERAALRSAGCQQALWQKSWKAALGAWWVSAGVELLRRLSFAVALASLLVWLCSLVPVPMLCHVNLFDALVFFFLKRDFSQFPILPFFRMPLNGTNS